MKTTRFNRTITVALLAALLAATGCSPRQSADRASVEIRGTTPGTTAPSATLGAAPATTGSTIADASGIVSYDGYQAAVAQSGDTVATVAQRIGLSASELGSYNGLSPTHPLRPGDELVLPPRPGGYATGTETTTVPAYPSSDTQIAVADPLTTQIEAAPLDTNGATAPPTTEPTNTSGGGWSPEFAAAAIDRAVGIDNQGNLAAPPSAVEALPPDPQAPAELASPQLKQYQTPTTEQLIPAPQPRPVVTITTPSEQPVEDMTSVETAVTEITPQPVIPRQTGEFTLIPPVSGPVVTRFNQGTGRGRNDGIDFATPSGSPVIASAEGEVALVSQSLGGLGTIVLIRHYDDYLTVYGRIERVTVGKGDIVSRGQQIGVVSPSPQPRMHFEVRKGAESMDPERFF
ncbi:MAG TPA: peptidoglycan DD-metalloendopeptidase family protein [Thermohalobaculum sp.]|nr:peptidoglycan DD-metalloendopeptidase family protein [Thermohalobaculum sp.]